MRSEIVGSCWSCGKDMKASDYGRELNCLECGKPTRVCLNCRWYDKSKTNACAEPMAEEVMEKERPNFCNFFEPEIKDLRAERSSSDADHLAAAEDLFKF
jgi:CO dehydrogenase/acetyl-CoA synthase gamma subunit (corrinoid Fe-S protein)